MYVTCREDVLVLGMGYILRPVRHPSQNKLVRKMRVTDACNLPPPR